MGEENVKCIVLLVVPAQVAGLFTVILLKIVRRYKGGNRRMWKDLRDRRTGLNGSYKDVL